jgi:predicted RecB family nuclease
MENKDNKDNKDNNKQEFVNDVIKLLENAGIQVFDPLKPSLTEIIQKETSEIIKKDPLFFQKYNIPTPKNPEERIFDLYYPGGGKDGVNYVTTVAKLRFQQLNYYLQDPQHQDKEHQDKLNFAIQEIKDIFQGPGLLEK